MKIIKIKGCKKIKSLLGFAETVKQSSNYFNETVDALIFACRQKRHDLSGQKGRSMIEMLGVLAIIGILSVGGLVGYSKAIDRYRVNETINQITHIVQNTRDLFKNQKNFYGALSSVETPMSIANYENRKLADKAKLFPTSIVKNGYKNLFGGEIKFSSNSRFKQGDRKAFIISFLEIPDDACIEIVTNEWSFLGAMAIRVLGKEQAGSRSIDNTFSGDCISEYKKGGALVCGFDMPMAVAQAVNACTSEKNNRITWKFY